MVNVLKFRGIGGFAMNFYSPSKIAVLNAEAQRDLANAKTLAESQVAIRKLTRLREIVYGLGA